MIRTMVIGALVLLMAPGWGSATENQREDETGERGCTSSARITKHEGAQLELRANCLLNEPAQEIVVLQFDPLIEGFKTTKVNERPSALVGRVTRSGTKRGRCRVDPSGMKRNDPSPSVTCRTLKKFNSMGKRITLKVDLKVRDTSCGQDWRALIATKIPDPVLPGPTEFDWTHCRDQKYQP